MKFFFRLFSLILLFANLEASEYTRELEKINSSDPSRINIDFFDQKDINNTIDKIEIEEASKIKSIDKLYEIKFKFISYKIFDEDNTVVENSEFDKVIKELIDKTISVADLYTIASMLTEQLRNKGYLLSRIIVPKQTIQKGNVSFKYIQGYVSHIEFDKKFQFESNRKKDIIHNYSKSILDSKPLKAKDLERSLLLLSDIPGVRVKAILAPDKEKNFASKLIYRIKEQEIKSYVSVDNRGNEYTGTYQVIGGINFNNKLKRFEEINLNYMTSNQVQRLQYLSASYKEPMSYYDMMFNSNLSYSSAKLGSDLKPLRLSSNSLTFSIGVSYPYIRTYSNNLYFDVDYYYLYNKSFVLDTLSTDPKISKLLFGISGDFRDKYGTNRYSLKIGKGLNMLGAGADVAVYPQNAKFDFTKIVYEYTRVQGIYNTNFTFLFGLKGQQTSDILPPSQRIGLGGKYYLRGYDSSHKSGDKGLMYKFEPQYNVSFVKDYIKMLNLYLFYDSGTVQRIGQKKESLKSSGLGFRVSLTDKFNINIELANQLDDKKEKKSYIDLRYIF